MKKLTLQIIRICIILLLSKQFVNTQTLLAESNENDRPLSLAIGEEASSITSGGHHHVLSVNTDFAHAIYHANNLDVYQLNRITKADAEPIIKFEGWMTCINESHWIVEKEEEQHLESWMLEPGTWLNAR